MTAVSELVSLNPATEAVVGRHAVMTAAEIDAALDRSAAARPGWAAAGVDERCRLLRSVAATLRANAGRYAATITAEMGKTLKEAKAEVEKCAFACDHFAGVAPGWLADEDAPSDGARSFIRLDPLGTVLACMPWNFPFWQVFRCAAPALAAGNTVVLKHADNVSACAGRVEESFREAGFQDGVFTTLVVPVPRVADLIADPRIDAVSLTGSTAAGRAVGAQAGAAIKKAVLELGGSDAFIVLDDADVAAAAKVAATSRFQNCGQSCIAAKRFIVVGHVADAFTDALVAATEALQVGDPLDPATTTGPLARADLRDRVEEQIADATARGARLLTGGTRPGGPGFFLGPAVLSDCTTEMRVFTEETFGPVAPIAVVANEEEAVAVANAGDYGLGGNVWTRDVERGLAVASRLTTGGVFINGMTHSDPRLPFGGVRQSGYGRELHRFGLHEFVNVKTMWVGE